MSEFDEFLTEEWAQFAEFYRHVSHVTLGDELWLHSPDLVRRGIADPLTPSSLPQVGEHEVVVFASDGGGGQFALGRASGRVYHLPPGAVENGVYTSFPATPVETVADDLATFLTDLLDIVRQSKPAR